MTTDLVPKTAFAEVALRRGVVRVAGMTKGSGMIQPQMATTLGFVMTDANIPGAPLRGILKRSVERSYNRLSVDGDTSTNDTLLLLANGGSGVRPDPKELPQVEEAIAGVMARLAQAIARDGEGARKAGAAHVLTAHTLDDQAETVLIRMSRGSGLTGLSAMARTAPLPPDGKSTIVLVRPLLDIAKSRLIATLDVAKIPYADDPSNRNPRFTRARLRGLMGALAAEGLDANRLAQLARRLKRAEGAIEAAVDRAMDDMAVELAPPGSLSIETRRFAELPGEIALRLLGRAVARAGDEGPVELGKLEALKYALDCARMASEGRFRRTLAGALVTLTERQLIVERAPARGRGALTNRRHERASQAKTR